MNTQRYFAERWYQAYTHAISGPLIRQYLNSPEENWTLTGPTTPANMDALVAHTVQTMWARIPEPKYKGVVYERLWLDNIVDWCQAHKLFWIAKKLRGTPMVITTYTGTRVCPHLSTEIDSLHLEWLGGDFDGNL